jgi:hydroxymethylpyrimidine pyrophosphatase-like HAD family hydrolase
VHEVKLIACDLDGTLLRSDRSVSERTRVALGLARRAGVATAVATGRPRYIAEDVARDLGVDFAVYMNGTQTVRVEDHLVLRDHLLSPGHAYTGIEAARTLIPGAGVSVEFADHTLLYETGFLDMIPLPPPAEVSTEVARIDLTMLRQPVRKLSVFTDAVEVDDLLDLLAYGLPPHLSASHAGLPFAELGAPGVSKATALAALVVDLGATADNVIVFGDERNDHEMLVWAGCGVAMGNADSITRSLADLVAGTNDDDGVAAVLERVAAGGWLVPGPT